MTTDRDPAVGALLDRLPVDPAPPAFWYDLRTRLQDDAVVPLRPVPAPAVRGRRDDPRYRRRRIVAGAVAAAAAVLIAVVAGAALRDDRDDVRIGPITPPDSSQPTTTTLGEDQSSGTTAPDGAITPSDNHVAAAAAWVRSIDAGDADAAWALVGEQSRDSIGGRAAFDDLMASALREGWGAWEQDGVTVSAAEVTPTGNPPVWLISFHGVIAQEGDTAFRSAALLVTQEGERYVVEPFLPGASIGLIELPPGATVAAGDPIRLAAEADALGLVVLIDGLQQPETAIERDGAGTATAVIPGPELEPGEHAIAVGMVTASGTFTVASATFTVAD
jgi:hypothetical protein